MLSDRSRPSCPVPDDDMQDELRGSLDVQARLLYGLIHARWIVTARGLAKMVQNICCHFITASFQVRFARSTNTREAILVAARACSANRSPCFRWGSLTCPMRNQSNCIVAAARTSIPQSPLVTDPSTGHTLARPSPISSSSSTHL
jgi:hypothetical protein